MPNPVLTPVRHVSFPRSGHHLLLSCLLRVLHSNLRYCEYYTHCRKIPCTDPQTNYQKNHDFGLRLARQPEYKYIIQTRHPIEAIASWYDYQLANPGRFQKMLVRDQPWYWKLFFAQKIRYWKRFIEKWFAWNSDGNAITITYEQLVENPVAEVERVLQFICPDLQPDRDVINSVVADRQIARLHDIRQFRYYDPQWAKEVEQNLAAQFEMAGIRPLN